jgi:capsular polysaccharide biosynthesis protein
MPLPRVRYAANVSELLRKDTEAALQSLERIVKASPAPTVRQLHDVYVNRQGQVWNREATLYIACNSAVPKASRAAESKAPVLDAAVLAIEPHNNIYHWMVEYLPALAWRLDASALDIPVLIRDDAPPFVASTLELAAARPLSITPTADAVFVRRLLVSEARAVLQARTQITRPLFARIRIEAARRSTVARPRRLYISRRDSAKRQMVNELELEAALARRGFEIVTMTGRDLVEQIALVDGADTVVAPHGAGLALLAAARPGRKVFEIVPGMRAAMTIRTCMAHLSRMVGHHHCMWVERAPPAQMGRWSVSLAPALEFLDEFLDA